jgi:hypothetical protein
MAGGAVHFSLRSRERAGVLPQRGASACFSCACGLASLLDALGERLTGFLSFSSAVFVADFT